MAQKPLLWEEVGAHAGAQKVKNAMGRGGQARVSRGARARVCFVFEASWAVVWRRQLTLYGAPRRGLCAKHRL
jgi:hypothetical protein